MHTLDIPKPPLTLAELEAASQRLTAYTNDNCRDDAHTIMEHLDECAGLLADAVAQLADAEKVLAFHELAMKLVELKIKGYLKHDEVFRAEVNATLDCFQEMLNEEKEPKPAVAGRRCSECNLTNDHRWKYCSDCGELLPKPDGDDGGVVE